MVNQIAARRTPRLSVGIWAAAMLLASGNLPAASAGTNGPIQFNRDIRRILADNCFPCHGFDVNKRKADLRLDTPDGATAVHKGRQAIKPGDLNGSELWRRVSSTDPKALMPPPES